MWGGFSIRDADFNLPQHRYDLLWFVPLDGHDPLFLQVDSLSFHLVQKSPVTSKNACVLKRSVERGDKGVDRFLHICRAFVVAQLPEQFFRE
jgi:hypothetical protein